MGLDQNSGTRNPTRGYVASRYSLLAYAAGYGAITAGICRTYDPGHNDENNHLFFVYFVFFVVVIRGTNAGDSSRSVEANLIADPASNGFVEVAADRFVVGANGDGPPLPSA